MKHISVVSDFVAMVTIWLF